MLQQCRNSSKNLIPSLGTIKIKLLNFQSFKRNHTFNSEDSTPSMSPSTSPSTVRRFSRKRATPYALHNNWIFHTKIPSLTYFLPRTNSRRFPVSLRRYHETAYISPCDRLEDEESAVSTTYNEARREPKAKDWQKQLVDDIDQIEVIRI